MEKWKEIEDYPNYDVSNMGNVRNRTTGKILKPFPTRKGYLLVRLYTRNEAHKSLVVHRLVATYFISNWDGKAQVNHKDGVKSNNKASNLEWSTGSENVAHAINLGLRKVMCAQTVDKKPVLVADIVSGKITGYYASVAEAAKGENVSRGNVNSVLKGTRRHTKNKVFVFV